MEHLSIPCWKFIWEIATVSCDATPKRTNMTKQYIYIYMYIGQNLKEKQHYGVFSCVGVLMGSFPVIS